MQFHLHKNSDFPVIYYAFCQTEKSTWIPYCGSLPSLELVIQHPNKLADKLTRSVWFAFWGLSKAERPTQQPSTLHSFSPVVLPCLIPLWWALLQTEPTDIRQGHRAIFISVQMQSESVCLSHLTSEGMDKCKASLFVVWEPQKIWAKDYRAEADSLACCCCCCCL